VDAFGNLFIADTWNDRIRKVEINGIITTMAGNGTNGYAGDGSVATSAELSGPNGVTVDAFGSLFIADSGNQRIRKVVFQGASLVFPSVAVSNAGSYDVVVTSPYGSMTSSVVTLTVTQITPVVTPFNLSNFGFASSNTFQIQFTNTPGATFSLWASTNLCDWTQIGTATEDLPGVYEASDPSATNCGVRFYQLRWP
jgi:sugar lactone lactonase YvrE